MPLMIGWERCTAFDERLGKGVLPLMVEGEKNGRAGSP